VASTALVVLVPEAERIVAAVRARHDPAVQLGVPAHVTVLYPFMPPDVVSPSAQQLLQRLFARFASFSACFTEVCRWPQEAYLAPKNAAPFIALTRAVFSAFPEFPPYEGRHADIVPHLTIAQGSAAAAEQAREEGSAALAAAGAIRSVCRTVTLLENSTGRWRVMHSYPLAPHSSTASS
jgi:2'-5' RNA ligase